MTRDEMRDAKMADLLDRGNYLEEEIRKVQAVYLKAAAVENRALIEELEILRFTMRAHAWTSKHVEADL